MNSSVCRAWCPPSPGVTLAHLPALPTTSTIAASSSSSTPRTPLLSDAAEGAAALPPPPHLKLDSPHMRAQTQQPPHPQRKTSAAAAVSTTLSACGLMELWARCTGKRTRREGVSSNILARHTLQACVRCNEGGVCSTKSLPACSPDAGMRAHRPASCTATLTLAVLTISPPSSLPIASRTRSTLF